MIKPANIASALGSLPAVRVLTGVNLPMLVRVLNYPALPLEEQPAPPLDHLPFIVVIIGGLGSVTGSLVGALIVGLTYNYVAYLVPWAAAAVNILIMVVILLIRPTGLFPAGK